MRNRGRLRKPGAPSFSLLELLIVMAVTAILFTVVIEGYSGVVQATAVTTGAALLRDTLEQGRVDAVAQNTTVEVRIYDVPPAASGAPAYDALQLHWLNPDGTTPAAAFAVLLPSWVVIDPTAAYSPLIALNTQTITANGADTRLNNQTRVFHFLPDGSTDLNPATNWFMTVRAASQSDPAHFPADWACVRVDAATGKVGVYRP